jgi:biopolymer transport protein ExbD
MQFAERKRRAPPTIIIISLIDILIVVLVFLLVATTFKRLPALKLALPESSQGKPGASESTLVVSINKQAPFLYLEKKPITPEQLASELLVRAAKNPQLSLSIASDKDAPVGEFIRVMDIARAAKLKSVGAFTKTPGQP